MSIAEFIVGRASREPLAPPILRAAARHKRNKRLQCIAELRWQCT